MRSNAEGAIKKQVQLHDGLFLVINVARVQTTNWALSCNMQVLPVGSFLLAQGDQRNQFLSICKEDEREKTSFSLSLSLFEQSPLR